MMVEVGLVHELVEIELIVAEKRITELTLETLRVGTVAKLCMVLQVDHAKYLKDKVMEILKWHSELCTLLDKYHTKEEHKHNQHRQKSHSTSTRTEKTYQNGENAHRSGGNA
ncbi:hypothetical protein JHK84_027543 [Glycine max]|nr:hypothetical protein JHK84_027543 [Glycine max]